MRRAADDLLRNPALSAQQRAHLTVVRDELLHMEAVK